MSWKKFVTTTGHKSEINSNIIYKRIDHRVALFVHLPTLKKKNYHSTQVKNEHLVKVSSV